MVVDHVKICTFDINFYFHPILYETVMNYLLIQLF
jgi:hypothetical protein